MENRPFVERVKSTVRYVAAFAASIVVISLFATGYARIMNPNSHKYTAAGWGLVIMTIILLAVTIRLWKNWFYIIPGAIGGRTLIGLAFGRRFPNIPLQWLAGLCILMVVMAVLSIRFTNRRELSGFDQLNLLVAASSVLVSITSVLGMSLQNTFALSAVGIGDMALFLSWVQDRIPSKSSTLHKKLFLFQDSVAVDVRNIAAAQQWYSEKLGLSYSSTQVEEASMVLGYSADDAKLYLVEISGNRRPNSQLGRAPIMFVRNLAAAHEHLSARGVTVGPLQNDSGGNNYFRFRDLENNELEVCQEP